VPQVRRQPPPRLLGDHGETERPITVPKPAALNPRVRESHAKMVCAWAVRNSPTSARTGVVPDRRRAWCRIFHTVVRHFAVAALGRFSFAPQQSSKIVQARAHPHIWLVAMRP
jgi:hypothetical protein